MVGEGRKEEAMRRMVTVLMVAVVAGLALAGCNQGEGRIRREVENAATVAFDGLNRGDMSRLPGFFATEPSGANKEGLANTLGALESFAAELGSGDTVQVHSFDVEEVVVHDERNLGRVTYRLHMSVLRNGEPIFSVVATQNLAMLRVNGAWRIGGGDTPQLSEVVGAWPPAQVTTH
jgi:hypothetical protein